LVQSRFPVPYRRSIDAAWVSEDDYQHCPYGLRVLVQIH
jgi:hypothetical protein